MKASAVEPLPVPIWITLPMLKRPACVVALGLIAAAAVVTLR